MELPQDTHEGILRDHLQRHGVHVEFGTSLESFEQDLEGVTAHLTKMTPSCRSGPKSREECMRVRYLVGADGARGECAIL